MSEKLILWINDTDAGHARWLVLDANGNRAGFPQQGSIEDAAPLAEHRRVIALLPGERILAASARVPGNNPRRILQAAPYALEEKLAGDVDALHVALLARGAEQRCDFLVVERDAFDDMLARLADAGMQPDAAWPDYLAVPASEDAEHWLLLDEGRLLAHHGWQGFAAAAADAAFLLGRRDEDDLPLSVSVVGDQPLPGALTDRESERIADTERAFTDMATAAVRLSGNGLLQGEFRRKRESESDWRRWTWPAVAAAAWLAIALANYGIDIYRLHQEHAMLESATRDLFQQALPGNQRMVDPRFQIEQALGAGADADNLLLTYIADVARVVQATPDTRLNSFNYRNDYLEFSVTVPNATTLESLRTQLSERSGQMVDVQAANSVEGGLEGRLQIGGNRG